MSHEERLKETFEGVEKIFPINYKLQWMNMQVVAVPKEIKEGKRQSQNFSRGRRRGGLSGRGNFRGRGRVRSDKGNVQC